jgi:hypothetical protein
MGHECLPLKSNVCWEFLLQICLVYLVVFLEMSARFGGEMTFKFLVVILCKSGVPRGFETRNPIRHA